MSQRPPLSMPYILPLDSDQASLPAAGGKGANLARLAREGYPVPGGFILTTRAYRDFVAANRLERRILSLLPGAESADAEALTQISHQIRALFATGKILPGIADELRTAYASLGEKPVAVRSSATAEDLPGMSFAGQQETYLNVVGAESILQAVVECWSSLWTARAIGYRSRNRVDQAEAALAVVVQEMVESQAAGVLFTANPVTGLRSETVIEAALGLGEALVSGQVEPDRYVVDTSQDRILSKTFGAKSVMIHGRAGGGTQKLQQDGGQVKALPDTAILDLARLGSRVAGSYAFPQDIEWAWAGGKLYLLQTRPITALFPTPEGLPVEPLKVLFSLAAVQGMLDPMTPLGLDALRQIFAVGAGLFGVRVTSETQTVIYTAGERLWINLTPLIKNSFGRRVLPVVFSLVEPTVRQALEQIWDDPRLQPGRRGVSFHALNRLRRFFLPLGFNILLNLISPRHRREMIVQRGENILEMAERRCAEIRGEPWEKLAQRADLLPELTSQQLPRMLVLFISAVAAGMASWNLLNMLSGGRPGEQTQRPETRDLVLQVTRGMPYNPTTEMDLALWEMAKVIRRDTASMEAFQNHRAPELAQLYRSGDLPEVARQVVGRFLGKYGGRGFGEIDLGRARWVEDATHVFEMLGSFLQIEDEAQAPDVVFTRAAVSAQQAVAQLASAVRQMPHGWIRSRLVRFFAGRARQLMGARESPKFFAVRLMYLIHRELLKSGEELARAGELANAGDLFFLTLRELKEFAAHQQRDWRGLITARRAAYQNELLRRQIPRLLLSDGRAFYEGLSNAVEAENVITGSPVSPGRAEGRLRVVLDPRQAGLQPGEILVCPGTDPSWTPLFLSAAGLVMETGGMMTHGAVVAREYGIPAIVGVDRATTRLRTGQRVRIDGSSGRIEVVEKGNN